VPMQSPSRFPTDCEPADRICRRRCVISLDDVQSVCDLIYYALQVRAGEPLPTQEYNVDPNTGAIVATDGATAEYAVASLNVRGHSSTGWWGVEPTHRTWQSDRGRGRRAPVQRGSFSDSHGNVPHAAGSGRYALYLPIFFIVKEFISVRDCVVVMRTPQLSS